MVRTTIARGMGGVRVGGAVVRVAALVLLIVGALPITGAAQSPRISITNACTFPVWIAQTPNGGFSPLPGDDPNPAAKLNSGQTVNYSIPPNGPSTNLTPRTWGGETRSDFSIQNQQHADHRERDGPQPAWYPVLG
jgi:hypothetical protein